MMKRSRRRRRRGKKKKVENDNGVDDKPISASPTKKDWDRKWIHGVGYGEMVGTFPTKATELPVHKPTSKINTGLR